MLQIKKTVYVKKKFLFQEKSDTLELEKKNYIFQSKINFIKNMTKFKDSFQAKRLPANDKDDSAFLFNKVKENKRPTVKEKRIMRSSVKREKSMNAGDMSGKEEPCKSQLVSLSRKVKKRMIGRSLDKETPRTKLGFMFINNAAFRPKFKITEKSFQAMRKMNVKLEKDGFGNV